MAVAPSSIVLPLPLAMSHVWRANLIGDVEEKEKKKEEEKEEKTEEEKEQIAPILTSASYVKLNLIS